MKINSEYEILAPVGSIEMFDAAVAAKANAVYLAGNKFGARAYANNFDMEQLNNLIIKAHKNNIQVYITVNTLVKDDEYDALYEYLTELKDISVDAIIVQDIGVYYFIKKYFPFFELHASTQMAVNSLYGAKFIENLGFDRIVIGREVPLEEIRDIKDQTKLDIEAFVHGSLCVSVSGQCLVSSMIGGRSGNRGRCAQPCRKTFDIYDKHGKKINSIEDTFISARDLMTIHNIDKMVESGVYSLKIEGRMKKPEYVYTAVNEYRKALEDKKYEKDNLKLVSNRHFTDGLFFGDFGRKYYNSVKNPAGVLIGKIKKDKFFNIVLEKPLYVGDIISVTTNKSKKLNLTVTEDYKQGQVYEFKKFPDLQVDSEVYKLFSKKIVDELELQKVKENIIPLSIFVEAKINDNLKATILVNGKSIIAELDYVVDFAQNNATSDEIIYKQLNRLGNTDYQIEKLEINKDDNSFIPKSRLNELRRLIVEKCDIMFLNKKDHDLTEYKAREKKQAIRENNYQLSYEFYYGINISESLDIFSRVYIHSFEGIDKLRENFSGEIFYVYPRILTKDDYDSLGKLIDENLSYIDGFSANSLADIEFTKRYNKKIHLESNLNIFNSYALDFYNSIGINDVSLSNELTIEEIKNLDLTDVKTEIVGFGRLATMLLKHCPASVVKGCIDDSGCQTCEFQKDIRLKNQFDDFTIQRANGYSEVLTKECVNISGLKDEFDETNIDMIRIVDRDINEDEIEYHCQQLKAIYLDDKNIKVNKNLYTGHYKMGGDLVEDKVFATLEYDKIKGKLKEYCSSKMGMQKVDEMFPIDDIDQINHLQELTADAIELITKFSNPPLYGIFELKQILKRLEMGGILENYQFLQVADSLRVSSALKEYVEEMDEDNLIKDKINLLYTNKRVEAEIERIIVDDETIADDASRTLFNIRRSIRNKTDEIRKKLNSIVQDKDSQVKLQESFVTMRDGRYVVPVKSGAKGSFPGVTHDRSASGQTVYVEPMVVVELNNDIRQLQIEEHDEIRRILKELSELVGQYREEISINEQTLIDLDFTFAKAKMAIAMRASRPILNNEKLIDLRQVRHPLLKQAEVVPIDIRLGESFNALIITGPNTGGKTVSLKSLGLMVLMSQSGLFIPCDEFSKIGIFKNIYADIGDKQSIELSLSTFSASMSNIVDILKKADKDSLVLFDELGSGTDPTEGAALAMSIIDYLLKKDVLIVSTTHYSELKLYAMSTEGVQNASVEFDVETLSPTYRLIIGTPGKSNAFEISKRLGLSNEVLEHAASYISKENRDFESLISEIESDRVQAQKKLQEVDALKQKYENLNKQLSESMENKKLAGENYLEKSKTEARQILEDAKNEAKNLLKLAKRSIGNSSNLDRSYTEISDKYNTLQTKYEMTKPKKKKQANKNIQVKLGESVKILSMDDVGIVQTLPDAKGDLVVQIGILKFNVNISDIEKSETKEEKKKSSSAYRSVLKAKSEASYSSNLDLRGKNIEESITDVEKFLDNAMIIGLKEVQIIHGKGTGALRKGITEFLKKSKYVDEFRLGSLKEGGAGVTVVTLK